MLKNNYNKNWMKFISISSSPSYPALNRERVTEIFIAQQPEIMGFFFLNTVFRERKKEGKKKSEK